MHGEAIQSAGNASAGSVSGNYASTQSKQITTYEQNQGNASANNIYGPINYNGYGANNNTNINDKNEINNGIKDLEDIKDQNYAYKIIKENLCVPLKIAFNKEEFLMIGGYGSRFRGRKSFRY